MEALAIVCLAVLFGIGLYTGYTPLEKWPWAERLISSIVILGIATFTLFWISKSQGACLPPAQEDYISFGTVCRELFTLKHLAIGYSAFVAGLAGGILFAVVSKRLATLLRSRK